MRQPDGDTVAITRAVKRDDGVIRQLEGNTPLLLDDPGDVWLVESGSVELFAVSVAGGEAVGTRHHVASAATDAVLFGVDRGGAGVELGLLAVGAVGTRVAKVSATALAARARDPEQAGAVAAMVDGWISALAGGAVAGPPPEIDQLLSADDHPTLQDGQIAKSESGVVWVSADAGEVLFLGVDRVAVGDRSEPFPVAESAWVQAGRRAGLTTATTSVAIADEAAWRGLAAYHRLILRALARRLEVERAADVDRERRELAHNVAVRRHAVSELAGVLNRVRSRDAVEPGDEPLFTVCRLVFGAFGLQARRLQPGAIIDGDELAAIATASGVALRSVTLDDEWWRTENGPMIGYSADEARPLALLPSSNGRYELVDPGAGARMPVDAGAAGNVAPRAWQAYRPFPDLPLGVWGVLMFGLRGCRRDLARVAMMGVAAGLLALLPPLAVSYLFGRIIPDSDQSRLVALAGGLALSAVALAAFQITQSVAITRIESRIDGAIGPALWQRLLRLPTGFFRDYSAGNLAARAMGIDKARQILTGPALTSILGSIFSLFSFALMFYYSLRLALIAALFTVVAVVVGAYFAWRQLGYQRQMTAVQSNISGLVLQFLTGISKLRVAGAEDRAFGAWATQFARQQKYAMKAQQTANASSVFITAWPTIGTVALFAFVLSSGRATVSTAALLGFLAAFNQFMLAALLTSTALSSVLECVPLYELAVPILRTLPEVDDTKSAPGALSGAIELSHVTFRYHSDAPPVLHDVSLRIEPGQCVALVGPSGAGKSTIMRLLLGFETPERGTVYFDGRDLRGLDVQAVRRQMGVVTQDTKILPGPIYANILGASPLTIDDAWEAARLAAIDDEIRALPMGMHTIISEGGATFSGGQLQRLMIARAVVRKPRILLFDESTSALDNVAQQQVARSLDQLRSTRILIAHRLSTIKNADRIFVFEDGRIVQTGSYQELISVPGPFAEQARRQIA